MKKWLVLCLLVTGCFKTRSEVAEQEDRQKFQSQVSQQQQMKAEGESKQQEMEANMRQMYGRIESIEHRLNMDLENRQKESSGKEMTQKQIIEQMKMFEASLARIDQRLADIEARKSAPAAAIVATGADKSVKSKETEPSSWTDAEQLFNDKEWKKAILAYQKYRDENPKGKNFAEGTYKIGSSFQELGKKEEAKAFYEEVIEKFPKSSVARKATYRLKTLK